MLLIKNNKLIINGNKLGISVSKKEESNIPEGFVDLGLSVLWATCNLGADKPEGEGLYYKWGSKDGYTIDLVQNFNDDEVRTYDYDAVYYNCNFSENDKELLNPRVFSESDFSELYANTTIQYEVINGIQGVRYISNLNGNSIFLPLYNAVGNFDGYYPLNGYWTSSRQFSGNSSIGNAIYFSDLVNTFVTSGDSASSIANNSNTGLLIRAVCNLPPKCKFISYGESIQLAANDTNALFCFPKTWTATKFVSSSSSAITMYASNVVEFTTQSNDVNLLASYGFSLIGEERGLELSSREMKVITDKATDDYIYVRFNSKVTTTIVAYEWNASDCADKSTMIVSGKEMYVVAPSANDILRLRYDDWRGYDILLDWWANSNLPIYIADTCKFDLISTDPHVVHYANIKKKAITTIPASAVDSWADRVDSDGFLYLRLNLKSQQGYLIVTSARPAEEDSEI